MKQSLQHPSLCLSLTALFTGCIESREAREVSRGYENRNQEDESEQLPTLLAPLRFGMSASEAESAFSRGEGLTSSLDWRIHTASLEAITWLNEFEKVISSR